MSALLLSYALITCAQVISYGRMEPHALVLVLLGLAVGGYAILKRPPLALAAPTRAALVLCVVAMLLGAVIHNPLTYCGSPEWLTSLRIGVTVAVALLATYVIVPDTRAGWLPPLRFALLLLIGLAARVAVPLVSPSPGEDVWVVQQEAAQAILNGRDPYSVSYSQIFAPEVYAAFGYHSGFHYPPLSALPITMAYGLTHDIRWAYVVCELVVLLLFWKLLRRSSLLTDRAIRELILWLWAFNPSVLLVLEHSWTEPLGVLLLALFVWFVVVGRRWLSAGSLALFFSYKQYTLLFFPLLLFLPEAGAALLCFFLINFLSYVPWVYLGLDGLIANLIEPWRANPRPDGLSLAALWMRVQGLYFPTWVSPAALLGTLHLSISRLTRSPHGLLSALFLVFAALFITAKQSFVNYYYLLSSILIIMVAVSVESPESRKEATE